MLPINSAPESPILHLSKLLLPYINTEYEVYSNFGVTTHSSNCHFYLNLHHIYIILGPVDLSRIRSFSMCFGFGFGFGFGEGFWFHLYVFVL